MGKRKGRKNYGSSGGGSTSHKNKQKPFASVSGGDNFNYQAALQLAKSTSQTNDNENHSFNDIIKEVLVEAMQAEGEQREESFMDFFLENFMAKLLFKCFQHDGRPYSLGSSSDDDDDDDDDELWFRSQSPIYADRNRKRGKTKTGRFDDNSDVQEVFLAFIRMLLVQSLLEEEARQKKRFIWKSVIISFVVIAFIVWYWWY